MWLLRDIRAKALQHGAQVSDCDYPREYNVKPGAREVKRSADHAC